MLKVFEMFAGDGGASFALKKAGIDFECIGYSEIDKFAIQCYNQNHWKTKTTGPGEVKVITPKNYGDCTKIDPNELPDFDLLTGGFPCQSFSVAGKGLGELDTRGTLFNEIIRIAEVKKPRYMLLENVKGLTNKPHRSTFEKILSELSRIGYDVDWKVLNTKEHGIPQNRERVFFVCYRQDVYGFDEFEFPEKEELKIFLKDILEDEVDEKYYLKQEIIEKLITDDKLKKYLREKIANCQTSSMWKGVGNDGVTIIPVLTPERLNKRQNGRRFKEDGDPSFTVTAQDRHGILQIGSIQKESEKRVNDCPLEINLYLKENKGDLTIKEIAEKIDESLGKVEHYFRRDQSRAIPKPDIWFKLKEVLGFDNTYDKIVTELEKFYVKYESSRRVYSSEGCSPTISAANADKLIQNNFTIRKLTPKECFRLMGFNDEIDLKGISDSQRYKLAGNGFDINLVSKIFTEMFQKPKGL